MARELRFRQNAEKKEVSWYFKRRSLGYSSNGGCDLSTAGFCKGLLVEQKFTIEYDRHEYRDTSTIPLSTAVLMSVMLDNST